MNALASYVRKSDRNYVEPFAGSAALYFGAKPSKATLGDKNLQLINFYRYLREKPEELYKSLLNIERNEESYYKIRNKFNLIKEESFESAILFAYLNRNCFNGIWRTNRKGEFNVPYSRNSRSEYPSLSHYLRSAEILASVKLIHGDFRETLKGINGENAFIFADPPYFTRNERVFVEYGSESFGENDLTDLTNLLIQLADSGAKVVLSYNESPQLIGKFKGWKSQKIKLIRNVGGFVGSRKCSTEILITNDECLYKKIVQ